MKSIVFTNQKGGVGKTTLTRELGVYLASLGSPVLLIDADPQGNLTKSLCAEGPGLYDALTDGGGEVVPVSAHLNLLRGDVRLALLEKEWLGEIDGYSRVKELLSGLEGYAYVLIDTPPSLGVLTINALTAVEYLVIPTVCGLYSLQGTNALLATVAKVRKSLNPELTLLGVVINGYDGLPVITRQLRTEVEESFGSQVFGTRLSRSIKLEEAIALKVGVIAHPRLGRSKVKQEVLALGSELLNRLGTME